MALRDQGLWVEELQLTKREVKIIANTYSYEVLITCVCVLINISTKAHQSYHCYQSCIGA